MKETWIWLPESVYPNNQTTRFDMLSDAPLSSYTIAEFKRTYEFDKPISLVTVYFSADTDVHLYCNNKIVATGPATVGGDFLGNGKAREWYYANKAEFTPGGNKMELFARVKMCPSQICEFSKGHGGFMLWAAVHFEDGSFEPISTDDTWFARKNSAFVTRGIYDGRIQPDNYVNAQVIPDVWHVTLAPIPVESENELLLGEVELAPHEEVARSFELDMIYAGYLHVWSDACEAVNMSFVFKEVDEPRDATENVILSGNGDEYRSFNMESIGSVTVTLKNESDTSTSVNIGIVTTCYPVEADANTTTDDKDLNEVLKVCKHTLKYCRQTHHLDSPRHCEPLACTGDYYIESLMTAFSFGDMRLAEFDVERTAEILRHNDGRMFHTTYSLIWVRMLYDVYMLGGNFELLTDCRDALDMLLARFGTYVGENGLIETPPDYMFIDWIYIDGFSMHHPPKALGQSVLNMFYFMALNYAELIYCAIGDKVAASECRNKKTALKTAVNTLLFNKDKGMYFEGLNTPIPSDLINEWQEQNTQKRYYLKHSNITAAYTSICDEDTARTILDKIMSDEIEGVVQPYFQHYLLEAIFAHGLRDKYTLKIIDNWKQPTKDCSKGLVEGFYAPEPTYTFDHSHAWGGTPLYSLPKALTGVSVIEAGYKKVRLEPSLLGLNYARVEIPTPFGMITCEQKQGSEPVITVPEGIILENNY